MTVEIEGVTLHLAHPDELPVRWVGQEELMRHLLAAWMVVTEQDVPMNPRLIGKPSAFRQVKPVQSYRFPYRQTSREWTSELDRCGREVNTATNMARRSISFAHLHFLPKAFRYRK
jgi:hypothetical protein